MSNTTKNNHKSISNVSEGPGSVISHFRIGMEIGRGSFANVYKGNDLNNNNKTVAIKSVFRNRLKSEKLVTNLGIEIKILRNLKNPHIVSLLDCVKTDQYFHLIMDYCSLGDLSYFIRKREQLADYHPIIKNVLEKYPSPENSNGLNTVLVINFIKQLSSALLFLRSQNLIHRDIKPQNLLLCTPVHTRDDFINNNYVGLWELPILKVADFGFARYLPSTSMAETLCGSPLYMAPEILRYEKYNAKADLWSVGTVIYEMTIGKPPFRASNHIELLKKIEKSKDIITFPNNIDLLPDLKRLICSLLKANPIDRMGFNEFFNDPIIVSNDYLMESSIREDSITYSFDNEEMYVSEYLIGKPLVKNDNEIDQGNKISIIQEEPGGDSFEANKKYLEQKEKEKEKEKELEMAKNQSLKNKNTKIKAKNTFLDEILKGAQNANIRNDDNQLNSIPTTNTSKPKNKIKDEDVVVEKDYVVVERRNVEINSFADEIQMANNNNNDNNNGRPYNSIRKNSMNTRRYSLSVSPSTALKEVLDYTSEKLFGANLTSRGYGRKRLDNELKADNEIEKEKEKGKEEEQERDNERRQELEKKREEKYLDKIIINRTNSGMRGGLINRKLSDINSNNDNNENKNEVIDDKFMREVERLAMMSHCISLYGLVKYEEVYDGDDEADDINGNDNDNYNYNDNNSYLREMDIKTSKEGLIIYLKVLDYLSEAIKICNEWWKSNKFKNFNNNNNNNKIVELIEWIRNKFNESLEKAEYLKIKINKLENGNNKNEKNENIIFEKIIFDRAIEICRDTAIKEMEIEKINENENENKNDNNDNTDSKETKIRERYEECERGYSIAIWLLESIVSIEGEIISRNDISTVDNFIHSVGTRLIILRNKMK